MSEKKDDPREVLSLLNSLGFVGITAQQLKAFMKDLKMHRKIKERERENWKEETKKKILLRQQELYREVLQEHKLETMGLRDLTESTISSESSMYRDDDSSYKVVTVKIRCTPKDKENEPADNADLTRQRNKQKFKKTHTSWAEEFRQNSTRSDNDNNGYNTSSSSSVQQSPSRFTQSNNHSRNHSAGASTDSTKYISLEKPRKKHENLKQSNLDPPKSPRKSKSFSDRHNIDKTDHSKHAPSIAQHSHDIIPTNPPPSRSSVHSRPKSFIRPWRLQPEAHRSSTNTKSDPVALYQKYREEWKQLALPGEEHHAGVRWAVREKMLGNDPNPRCEGYSNSEMGNDFRSYSYHLQSISDRREYKVHRRSRKMKKFFPHCSSIGIVSKPVFIARRRRYTSFKSMSESILISSTSSEPQNPDGIRSLHKASKPDSTKKVKIQRDRNFTESVSCRVSYSEVRSLEVDSAKKTLTRIVRKLLKKDVESYVENYNKCMIECCCVKKTKEIKEENIEV